ncbi:MAG: hypothetical protein Q7R41_16335 [Phycisphaerales bacterium]|nr:hypothetical protein [Phycisphaerales bacterium]
MTDDEKVIADVEAMMKTPEHRAKRDAFAARLRRHYQPAPSREFWTLVVMALLAGILVLAVVDAAGG